MNMWLMRLGSDMAIRVFFLELTKVDEVKRLSSGRVEHFESCSSAAIQFIQQKMERWWAFEGGGSWFCAIPNQCLRLFYSSNEASVFFLVTRRISAAVYGIIIIIVCHTKSHSIPSDIAHRFSSFTCVAFVLLSLSLSSLSSLSSWKPTLSARDPQEQSYISLSEWP